MIFVITSRHGIFYKIDSIALRLGLKNKSVRKYYHRMKFLVKEIYGICPEVSSVSAVKKEAKV